MIQTTPLDILQEVAKALDEERAAAKVRGPLHGIPVLVKDNIATLPNTGLRTTAGSLSLWSSKPKENAKLVDLLIASGAIILGKANLSEFSNSHGSMMPSGWSAIGGQVQSAYVRGGLDLDDSKDGHSNPSGSSSGSAVAGRAALYTIKPTIGLIPQHGIVPMSTNFDSGGPMTKTSHDLAVLLDILASRSPSESYTKSLTGSWSGISVAALNYSKWRYPDSFIKPADGAEAQILKETREAYDLIKTKVDKFVDDVDLVTVDSFELEGKNPLDIITMSDMKRDLTAYL
ncbi:amidase signature domain-containing protein [Trichoderma sp. SZMC 28011]